MLRYCCAFFCRQLAWIISCLSATWLYRLFPLSTAVSSPASCLGLQLDSPPCMHQTLNRWATLIWFRSGAMKRAACMHVRSRSAAASAAMRPVNAVWICSVAAARTERSNDRTARMAFTGVTWDQDGRNLTPWPFEWFQNKMLSVYVLCVQRGSLFNERAVSRLGIDKQVHTLCALGELARGLWIRLNRVLQGTANHRWRQ